MQELPLIAVSRQSFSAVLDGNRWGVRVYEVQDGVMCADFSLNDSPVILGVRCVPGKPLLPYDYLQAIGSGNFAFTTLGNVYPWWEQFDSPSCKLIYASAAEIAA